MKITNLSPVVVSNHADEIVKLFEELGFEQKHHSSTENTDPEVADTQTTDLVDPNGFRVDVSQLGQDIPRDMVMIRMNVDDFDAAYQILLDRGFKNNRGDGAIEHSSVKSATMFSPSGFVITVTQHIRK